MKNLFQHRGENGSRANGIDRMLDEGNPVRRTLNDSQTDGEFLRQFSRAPIECSVILLTFDEKSDIRAASFNRL
jgi:hypothetical protein